MAVLPGAMFDSATLKRLSATKFLGGVLLLEDEGEDGADDVVTLSPAVAVTENGQAAGRVNDQWYSPDVTTPQVCFLVLTGPGSVANDILREAFISNTQGHIHEF